MTYKNIEPHRHCECGKILPPNQPICMECVNRIMEEEKNEKPREPYYKSSVKGVKE